MVMNVVRDNILTLSCHKYASNVIEKALEHCGPKEQQDIGRAILSAPPSLLTLRCSRYGRHAVRQLISVLQPPLRDEALRASIGSWIRLQADRVAPRSAKRPSEL